MPSLRLASATLDYPVVSPEWLNCKGLAVDAIRGRRTAPPVIRALDAIDLDLDPGDRLGIYGPNGSGKSSLLKLMAGIYPPSSGMVQRNGRVTALLGLGLGANIELSARDNIELLLRFEGLKPDTAMIDAIWAFAELERKFLDLSLRHFSTGMMMRLFFAVSTSAEPEILLMDEWLSVVDETFMHKAEARLRAFVGKAGVFAIASHNIHLLRDVCDRIIFLDNGRIVRTEPITA